MVDFDHDAWKVAFDAACEKSRQEKRRKRLERPAPQGYSSWEEYDAGAHERALRRDELLWARQARMKEVARETGRTFKEVYKEWNGYEMDSSQGSPMPAECDCDGE